MANTYTLIQSVTVPSGGQNAIDFTSIPSTYTDLLVRVSARKTSTGGSNLQLQFNGDTSSSSYQQRMLFGDSVSSPASYNDSSESIGFMYVTLSSATANTFSSTDIYIPNYTGSNQKAMHIDNVTENNTAAAGQVLTAGLWKNSSAINRVYLYIANGAGTFAQYSTASLYGIVKS